ncbi:MAG: hypothetical protein A4E70_02192 [Syntrophus sp. PtaU1.Bin005]|jgi:thymidylate kinase|uniref:hypothetical protein n=1 Tax=Syntrophus sp. (in: bacteria) TaxID=48412 RepID=UPI0009C76CD9|nr:MAG: hypothetical protein A4E69_03282 [Syntrophus sp. PtaB.Bin138]OPY79244.1 MAG: hypothetical protein A4E70_02192 [Syntrophus sp. PtaU1.Bin005]
MGIYFEIIGLPGSGKSMFFKAAVEHLERIGVRVFHRQNGRPERRLLSLYLSRHEPLLWGGSLRSLWSPLRDRLGVAFLGSKGLEAVLLRSFLDSHMELMALILKVLIRRGFPSWERELVLGRYLDSFAFFQIVQEVMAGSEAILTDPGLIQRGIALLGYRSTETRENDFLDYLGLTPLPEVLISVRVLPEVCLARMQQRSFPRRLRGLSDQDVMASLEICQTYQDVAEGEMKKRGVTLIRVENKGPLQTSIEQLQAGLDGLHFRA